MLLMSLQIVQLKTPLTVVGRSASLTIVTEWPSTVLLTNSMYWPWRTLIVSGNLYVCEKARFTFRMFLPTIATVTVPSADWLADALAPRPIVEAAIATAAIAYVRLRILYLAPSDNRPLRF